MTSCQTGRLAVIYVRQSTKQQVIDHSESTRLQYALVDRAAAMGWAAARIIVIDDDLGKSGSSAVDRAGFQRLVTEISLGHVGLVLGTEMSRLARSGKDWYQLIELCALAGALLADLDGVYDPVQYNDRLLLGLKGTMSAAELHLIKQRMQAGRVSKARRGEMAIALPAGYARRPSGEAAFDPDEQVQAVVRLVFAKFAEIDRHGPGGDALSRAEQGIEMGIRMRSGPLKGEVVWKRPARATITCMLHSPIYAGIYAYGRRRVDPMRQRPGHPGSGLRGYAEDEWLARIEGALPAYISVGQYRANLARLAANETRAGTPGAVRYGPALLAGLLRCGRCARRMTVTYHVDNGIPRISYDCTGARADYGGPACSAHVRALSGRVRHWSSPRGAGPCGRRGQPAGRRADPRRPGRHRENLAAAPGTRPDRRRPGPALLPADRTGKPPGGPGAGKGLGSRPRRPATADRGLAPLLPERPASADHPAESRDHRRRGRPAGVVGSAEHHRRRPQRSHPRRHRRDHYRDPRP